MKKIAFLLIVFALISGYLYAQNPVIVPIGLTIKKPDIDQQNEFTELSLSFRNLGREYLKVKSFNLSIVDDRGIDLIKKGTENLSILERNGFFSSVKIGWESFDYKFYRKNDAFRGKFTTYSAPHHDARYINIKGNVEVWMKGKTDAKEEDVLSGISIDTKQTYTFRNLPLRFVENGSLTLDDTRYKGYKIIYNHPVTSISVKGQKKLETIFTDPDEFYVNEKLQVVSLIFIFPDAQLINVPVDITLSVGL